MKPALTAEEWKQWSNGGILGLAVKTRVGIEGNARVYVDAHPISAPHDYHSIAALLLDGQPFGFTRDDVYVLRQLPAFVQGAAMGHGTSEEGVENVRQFIRDLADRIEALLPPEPPDKAMEKAT